MPAWLVRSSETQSLIRIEDAAFAPRYESGCKNGSITGFERVVKHYASIDGKRHSQKCLESFLHDRVRNLEASKRLPVDRSSWIVALRTHAFFTIGWSTGWLIVKIGTVSVSSSLSENGREKLLDSEKFSQPMEASNWKMSGEWGRRSYR